ncbi:unnamed protein product [Pseudo-nitzschia multistriata]|uniref:Uncharacterized protein n=1 Tax=Pseudo-nitzschia multistriata TaxID=183589 RepID=A0A448ZRZ4_9STRA|nr:unnamed protein product [Pseudo-nitzschia multistriata]
MLARGKHSPSMSSLTTAKGDSAQPPILPKTSFSQKRNHSVFTQRRRTAFNNLVCHRGFSTTDEEQTYSYSQLLTMATARQLKGDVPEAIVLASKALLILREKQLADADDGSGGGEEAAAVVEEELADALLFLGKLLQLAGNFADASRSFEEARWIFHACCQKRHDQEMPTQNPSKKRPNPIVIGIRKKECSALSHLAFAQSQLGQSPPPPGRTSSEETNDNSDRHEQLLCLAEANYKEALEGLEEVVGWEDGMTNHTAHELAMLYKQTGRYERGIARLTRTKEKLAEVWGPGDPKVVQLNGELAEMHRLLSSSSSSSEREGVISEEKVVALLEDALEVLPPNSPEARRIFVRLEELKEERELAAADPGDRSQTSSRGGVTVTRTKGSDSAKQ